MRTIFESKMKYGCLNVVAVFFASLIFFSAYGQTSAPFPIEGRWDMTIDVAGHQVPSWVEVTRSGVDRLVGQFVGTGGSARPISKINFENNEMSFSIPPQWEKENNDIVVNGTLTGEALTGTIVFSNGKTYNWTGMRAPLLKRNSPPVWGTPVKLFNGKDL